MHLRTRRAGSGLVLILGVACNPPRSAPVARAPFVLPAPQVTRAAGATEEQAASRVRVPAGAFLREGALIPVAAFTLDRATRTLARVESSFDVDAAHEGVDFDLERARFVTRDDVSVRAPHGASGPSARDQDPATQLTALEAEQLCAREGGRLPTEDEWEHAARNGRGTMWRYPWGDDSERGGRALANTWDGVFPTANTLRDGHLFASPVGAFPPTPLGFIDMVGNVWQWTSTPGADARRERVIRGGSYLCDPDVCHGFQVDARQVTNPQERFAHIGFRCAFDS